LHHGAQTALLKKIFLVGLWSYRQVSFGRAKGCELNENPCRANPDLYSCVSLDKLCLQCFIRY
jgi:hypothetical protein